MMRCSIRSLRAKSCWKATFGGQLLDVQGPGFQTLRSYWRVIMASSSTSQCSSPNVAGTIAICSSCPNTTSAIRFRLPGHSRLPSAMLALAFNVWRGAVDAARGDSTEPWRTRSCFVRSYSIAPITVGCRFRLCWAALCIDLTHKSLWPHVALCLISDKQCRALVVDLCLS